MNGRCPASLGSGRGTGPQIGSCEYSAVLSFVRLDAVDELTRNVYASAPAAEKAGRGTLPTTPAKRIHPPRGQIDVRLIGWDRQRRK
jgi:hypothetical protein